MFEINGQWYTVGNRVLNSLNFVQSGVGDDGLKAIYDVVLEQDSTNDQAPEGLPGLFRIVLLVSFLMPMILSFSCLTNAISLA